MPNIKPCLWFDKEAEDAAGFYCSVFPNSKLGAIGRYTEDGKERHGKEAGSVLMVEFELDGREFQALNGGPQFKIDEAVSFSISCKDQEDVDYYWSKLTADGGAESMCGWLKDKFGVSWQVVPAAFGRMMKEASPEQASRLMQAVFTMRKIDIAALERAFAA